MCEANIIMENVILLREDERIGLWEISGTNVGKAATLTVIGNYLYTYIWIVHMKAGRTVPQNHLHQEQKWRCPFVREFCWNVAGKKMLFRHSAEWTAQTQLHTHTDWLLNRYSVCVPKTAIINEFVESLPLTVGEYKNIPFHRALLPLAAPCLNSPHCLHAMHNLIGLQRRVRRMQLLALACESPFGYLLSAASFSVL